jgi:hypothetical protein
MAVLEDDVSTFIERGAAMEASVLQQLRNLLPPELASHISLQNHASAQSATEYTGRQLDWSSQQELAPSGKTPSEAIASGNGAPTKATGPGSMPSTDARAAAALTELGNAVQDLEVRVCSFCMFLASHTLLLEIRALRTMHILRVPNGTLGAMWLLNPTLAFEDSTDPVDTSAQCPCTPPNHGAGGTC